MSFRASVHSMTHEGGRVWNSEGEGAGSKVHPWGVGWFEELAKPGQACQARQRIKASSADVRVDMLFDLCMIKYAR